MPTTVTTTWSEGMCFDSQVSGHKVTLDSAQEFGGKDRGPRPKPLLLTALTGCTGMDVISILGKMKITPQSFQVTAHAQASEEHPKVYTSIHLTYEFKGEDLPYDKLKKAVDLSQQKYCGVSAMLKKACKLTYEIKTE
ncbi:MAG: OsmC family protein [Spirochaetota bacterium]